MITPPDYAYILIGTFLAGLVQFCRLQLGAEIPPWRVALSTSVIAAVAGFTLSGLLILFVNVPPLACMFLGAFFGWLGGEYVFNAIEKRLEQQHPEFRKGNHEK
jgi:fructose-specific phosphotransferase system IIC component